MIFDMGIQARDLVVRKVRLDGSSYLGFSFDTMNSKPGLSTVERGTASLAIW